MKEEFKSLVRGMFDFKLINQEQLDLLLALVSKEDWETDEWSWLMESYYSDLDDTLINAVLEVVKLAFSQDAEASQIPPPYENSMIPLLLDFVGLDQAAAKINLDYEQIEGGNDKYLLTINYANTKYQAALMDSGDYYDVGGMLKILNEITIDQGKGLVIRELSTNDQSFCYYKGEVELLNSFLSSYRTSMHK